MIEIIKREEGKGTRKERITGAQVQVCYNSWGHLSIRIIIDTDPMKDVLVVLDKNTSHQVMKFCRKISDENDHLIETHRDGELPF